MAAEAEAGESYIDSHFLFIFNFFLFLCKIMGRKWEREF